MGRESLTSKGKFCIRVNPQLKMRVVKKDGTTGNRGQADAADEESRSPLDGRRDHLVVEGKRQRKPSKKILEFEERRRRLSSERQSPAKKPSSAAIQDNAAEQDPLLKSVQEYSRALAEGTSKSTTQHSEKIKKILASQWKERIKRTKLNKLSSMSDADTSSTSDAASSGLQHDASFSDSNSSYSEMSLRLSSSSSSPSCRRESVTQSNDSDNEDGESFFGFSEQEIVSAQSRGSNCGFSESEIELARKQGRRRSLVLSEHIREAKTHVDEVQVKGAAGSGVTNCQTSTPCDTADPSETGSKPVKTYGQPRPDSDTSSVNSSQSSRRSRKIKTPKKLQSYHLPTIKTPNNSVKSNASPRTTLAIEESFAPMKNDSPSLANRSTEFEGTESHPIVFSPTSSLTTDQKEVTKSELVDGVTNCASPSVSTSDHNDEKTVGGHAVDAPPHPRRRGRKPCSKPTKVDLRDNAKEENDTTGLHHIDKTIDDDDKSLASDIISSGQSDSSASSRRSSGRMVKPSSKLKDFVQFKGRQSGAKEEHTASKPLLLPPKTPLAFDDEGSPSMDMEAVAGDSNVVSDSTCDRVLTTIQAEGSYARKSSSRRQSKSKMYDVDKDDITASMAKETDLKLIQRSVVVINRISQKNADGCSDDASSSVAGSDKENSRATTVLRKTNATPITQTNANQPTLASVLVEPTGPVADQTARHSHRENKKGKRNSLRHPKTETLAEDEGSSQMSSSYDGDLSGTGSSEKKRVSSRQNKGLHTLGTDREWTASGKRRTGDQSSNNLDGTESTRAEDESSNQKKDTGGASKPPQSSNDKVSSGAVNRRRQTASSTVSQNEEDGGHPPPIGVSVRYEKGVNQPRRRLFLVAPISEATTSSRRWKAGVHICNICQKDCGYKQNLFMHMKAHEKFGETPDQQKRPKKRKLLVADVKSSTESPQLPGNEKAEVKKKLLKEETASIEPKPPLVVAKRRETGALRSDNPDLPVAHHAQWDSQHDAELTHVADMTQDDEMMHDAEMADAGDVSELPGSLVTIEEKTRTTKWYNGRPPLFWVYHLFVCEVCHKDCGYRTNLQVHRKRTHGLLEKQKMLGPNFDIHFSEIERRKRCFETASSFSTDESDIKIVKLKQCGKCEDCMKPNCGKCFICRSKKKNKGRSSRESRCRETKCSNIIHVEAFIKRETVVDRNVNCQSCANCQKPDCGTCQNCLTKNRQGLRCLAKTCLNQKTTTPKTQPGQISFLVAKRTEEEQTKTPSPQIDVPVGPGEEDIEMAEVKSISVSPIDPDDATPPEMETIEDFVGKALALDTPAKAASKVRRISKENSLNNGEVPAPRRSVDECLLSVDFTEEFEPQLVRKQGQAVMVAGDCELSELCFICGSLGREETLLRCLSCCEPAHPFCLSEEEMPRNDDCSWVCSRCIKCRVCGGGQLTADGSSAPERQTCHICGDMYHSDCLPDTKQKLKSTKDKDDWICNNCMKCSSCGSSQVKLHTEKELLCGACCQGRSEGSYCPLCRGCYDNNDYDLAMMECATCGGWIHAQCEGLDGEQYQILSVLPDSVEYQCRKCSPTLPRVYNGGGPLSSEEEDSSLKRPKETKDSTSLAKGERNPAKDNQHSEPQSGRVRWLDAIRETLASGQRSVVDELWRHPHARHFRWDEPRAIAEPGARAPKGQKGPSTKRRRRHVNHSAADPALSPNGFPGHKNISHAEYRTRKQAFSKIKKEPGGIRGLVPRSPRTNSNVKWRFQIDNDIEEFSLGFDEIDSISSLSSISAPSLFSWTSGDFKRIYYYSDLFGRRANLGRGLDAQWDLDSQLDDCLALEDIEYLTDKTSDPNLEEQGSEQVYDLAELKAKVNAGKTYKSVLDFYVALSGLISRIKIHHSDGDRIRLEFRESFEKLLEATFPWFNPADPREHWEAWHPIKVDKLNSSEELCAARLKSLRGRDHSVVQPSTDHLYSETSVNQLRNDDEREENLNLNTIDFRLDDLKISTSVKDLPEAPSAVDKRKTVEAIEDSRKCVLCGQVGDRDDNFSGRLLQYCFNEWVHLNCALWSSEVYESTEGILSNVSKAVIRSRNLLCTHCKGKGATVGCWHNQCNRNYHFECAIKAKGEFKKNKALYCALHAAKHIKKPTNTDFQCLRPLVISREVDRRKRKQIESENIRLVVGGTVITALGRIVPASDTRKCLVPTGFVTRRKFWSAKNSNQITSYVCTTRLVTPKPDLNGNSIRRDDRCLVIDHSKQEPDEAQTALADFFTQLTAAEAVKEQQLQEVKIALHSDRQSNTKGKHCDPWRPTAAVAEFWPWLDPNQLYTPAKNMSDPQALNGARNSNSGLHQATPSRLGNTALPHTNGNSQTSPKNFPQRSPYALTTNQPVTPARYNRAVAAFRTTPTPVKTGPPPPLFSRGAGGHHQPLAPPVSASSAAGPVVEFIEGRIWFNANSKRKVREAITQTTQEYDDVQLSSNNCYSNNYPPPSDSEKFRIIPTSKPSSCIKLDLQSICGSRRPILIKQGSAGSVIQTIRSGVISSTGVPKLLPIAGQSVSTQPEAPAGVKRKLDMITEPNSRPTSPVSSNTAKKQCLASTSQQQAPPSARPAASLPLTSKSSGNNTSVMTNSTPANNAVIDQSAQNQSLFKLPTATLPVNGDTTPILSRTVALEPRPVQRSNNSPAGKCPPANSKFLNGKTYKLPPRDSSDHEASSSSSAGSSKSTAESTRKQKDRSKTMDDKDLLKEIAKRRVVPLNLQDIGQDLASKYFPHVDKTKKKSVNYPTNHKISRNDVESFIRQKEDEYLKRLARQKLEISTPQDLEIQSTSAMSTDNTEIDDSMFSTDDNDNDLDLMSDPLVALFVKQEEERNNAFSLDLRYNLMEDPLANLFIDFQNGKTDVALAGVAGKPVVEKPAIVRRPVESRPEDQIDGEELVVEEQVIEEQVLDEDFILAQVDGAHDGNEADGGHRSAAGPSLQQGDGALPQQQPQQQHFPPGPIGNVQVLVAAPRQEPSAADTFGAAAGGTTATVIDSVESQPMEIKADHPAGGGPSFIVKYESRTPVVRAGASGSGRRGGGGLVIPPGPGSGHNPAQAHNAGHQAAPEYMSSTESCSRPSTAGCSNSRGPTPARTPLLDIDCDMPGSSSGPFMCCDCGSTLPSRSLYEDHLSRNCPSLLNKKHIKVESLEDRKPDVSLDSSGSPRKDFSIQGLLTAKVEVVDVDGDDFPINPGPSSFLGKQSRVKVERDEEEIMIISENIQPKDNNQRKESADAIQSRTLQRVASVSTGLTGGQPRVLLAGGQQQAGATSFLAPPPAIGPTLSIVGQQAPLAGGQQQTATQRLYQPAQQPVAPQPQQPTALITPAGHILQYGGAPAVHLTLQPATAIFPPPGAPAGSHFLPATPYYNTMIPAPSAYIQPAGHTLLAPTAAVSSTTNFLAGQPQQFVAGSAAPPPTFLGGSSGVTSGAFLTTSQQQQILATTSANSYLLTGLAPSVTGAFVPGVAGGQHVITSTVTAPYSVLSTRPSHSGNTSGVVYSDQLSAVRRSPASLSANLSGTPSISVSDRKSASPQVLVAIPSPGGAPTIVATPASGDRKVARVQPTPQVVRPIPTKATVSPMGRFSTPAPTPPSNVKSTADGKTTPTGSSILAKPRLDPMKALTSLSRNPVTMTTSSREAKSSTSSITHLQRQEAADRLAKGAGSPSSVIVAARGSEVGHPKTPVLPGVKKAGAAGTAKPSAPLSSMPTQSYISPPRRPSTHAPGQSERGTVQPTLPRRRSTKSMEEDDDEVLDVGLNEYNNFPSSYLYASPSHEEDEDLEEDADGRGHYGVKYDGNGINVTTKASKTNSIKIILQRESPTEDYSIREVLLKDGSKAKNPILPKSALQALKIKAKISKSEQKPTGEAFTVPLFSDYEETFANEITINEEKRMLCTHEEKKLGKSLVGERPDELDDEDDFADLEDTGGSHDPAIMYNLAAEDGSFSASGRDITLLWEKVYDAVSKARQAQQQSPLPSNLGPTGEQMLGLTHSALRFLLEQFPGAKLATKYRWRERSKLKQDTALRENPTGCARSEPYQTRKEYDMFSWLASRHRKKPHPKVGILKLTPEMAADPSLQLTSGRRATCLDLPMPMRYRHLAKNAREAVGVWASAIHGRGLFCKREISAGEMVIEYAGEEIRAILTDKRENYYESKGIGCYMFRVDDDIVIDATMRGNAARFINHSCDPNCYSKIVDIHGKKHIIIFSLRKILPGEELTYDYKFPIEDVKIHCKCGARKCKKYMN